MEAHVNGFLELVPFQEIDVTQRSGFVKELNVDYRSRVKANDLMATLEIPELESASERGRCRG